MQRRILLLGSSMWYNDVYDTIGTGYSFQTAHDGDRAKIIWVDSVVEAQRWLRRTDRIYVVVVQGMQGSAAFAANLARQLTEFGGRLDRVIWHGTGDIHTPWPPLCTPARSPAEVAQLVHDSLENAVQYERQR